MLKERGELGNLISIKNEIDFPFSVRDYEAKRPLGIRSANGNLHIRRNARPVVAATAIPEPEQEIGGVLVIFGLCHVQAFLSRSFAMALSSASKAILTSFGLAKKCSTLPPSPRLKSRWSAVFPPAARVPCAASRLHHGREAR